MCCHFEKGALSVCSSEFKELIVRVNTYCKWTKAKCCCVQEQQTSQITRSYIMRPNSSSSKYSKCIQPHLPAYHLWLWRVEQLLFPVYLIRRNSNVSTFINSQKLIFYIYCLGRWTHLKNKTKISPVQLLKLPFHTICMHLLCHLETITFEKDYFVVLTAFSDNHYMCKLSVESLSEWQTKHLDANLCQFIWTAVQPLPLP